jgi:hypothetical protein
VTFCRFPEDEAPAGFLRLRAEGEVSSQSGFGTMSSSDDGLGSKRLLVKSLFHEARVWMVYPGNLPPEGATEIPCAWQHQKAYLQDHTRQIRLIVTVNAESGLGQSERLCHRGSEIKMFALEAHAKHSHHRPTSAPLNPSLLKPHNHLGYRPRI